MAVQFRSLPQIQNQNQDIDYTRAFQPVQNALAGYTQGINRKAQLDQQKAIGTEYNQKGAPAASRMAMEVGQLDQGRAFEKQGEQQQDQLMRRYVPLAQKAASDPQWAQANWSTIIQRLQRDAVRLGINDPLDPEDMDPATGPSILLSAAGVSPGDPLDRQLKQAKLDKIKGETGYKRNADGSSSRVLGVFDEIKYDDQGRPIDPFAPNEVEQSLGITREMKKEGLLSQHLDDLYGKRLKTGYHYVIGSDGEPRQMPVAGDSKAPKNDKILKTASTVMDRALGKLLDSNVLMRAASQYTDTGELAQAAKEFEMSALNIVYALSGKQTAVAEMDRFLRAYGPKPLDGAERLKAKANAVRTMLEALKNDPKDIEGKLRAASMTGGVISDQAARPQGNPDAARLKQKYGLE